ncbi:MAG TPA: hypothetical protein VGP76_17810 [Planctomycetaceae bacterium]|jgi:hypothetical protein|nr:hypothetical protein [Planctomycetaceae bacterium]
MILVRPRVGRALDVALACALILEFAGCAPSADSQNPWAEFHPAPAPIQKDASSAAPAGSVDEPPIAEIRAPGLSVNLDDAPRFDLREPKKRIMPRSARRREYPPPAPPAEEPVGDGPQYKDTLADKPPVPPESTAESSFDVPAHWSGAVIYCQPGCVPCAMQIRDLRKAGWKCGVGDNSHFKIVELLTLVDFEKRGVPSTPQTAYFIEGVEQPPRITGYGGTSPELAAIVNRHPKLKRSARVGTAMQSAACACLSGGVCVCNGDCRCAPIVSTRSYGASPLWYEVAPLGCAAPAMASCAAPSSYLMDSVPATVSYAAPVYVAPPVYARSGVTFGPATHSAQLSLFGFPLVGGSIGTTMSW